MSLARKGLIVSMGAYATIVVQLAQAMILSRALGPDGSGQLTMFRQTFVLGTQIASLGLPMAMIHAINKELISPLRALKTVVNFSLLMSVLSVIILSAGMWFLSDRQGSQYKQFAEVNWQIILSTAIIVPSVLLYNVYLNFNASRLEAKKLALLTFIPPTLLAMSYGISWAFFELDVYSTILAESIIRGGYGMLVAYLLTRETIIILKKDELNLAPTGMFGIDWKFTISQIPFGLQMVATDFLVLINAYFISHILKFFTNDSQVGYYSRGIRLATLTILAIQAMQKLLYANWSKLEGKKLLRSVEKVVNACMIMSILMSIFVALAAKPITLILFGREFLPAVPVTRMALIGLAAYMIVRLLQGFFNSQRKTYYNITVLGTGTICSFIFAIKFIPNGSAVDAVKAVNIGYFSMMAVALYIGCFKCGLKLKGMLIPSKDIVKRLQQKLSRGKK